MGAAGGRGAGSQPTGRNHPFRPAVEARSASAGKAVVRDRERSRSFIWSAVTQPRWDDHPAFDRRGVVSR